jgi:hypothetical protein
VPLIVCVQLRDDIEAATGASTGAQATAQPQHGKKCPVTTSTSTTQATTARKAGPSKGGKKTPAGKGRRLPKTHLLTPPHPTATTIPGAPALSFPPSATATLTTIAPTIPHLPIAMQHETVPSMAAPQPRLPLSGPTAQQHMMGTPDIAPVPSAVGDVFTLGASGDGKAKAPSATPPLPKAFATSTHRRPTKSALQPNKTPKRKPTAGGLPAPTSSATPWHFDPNAMRQKLSTSALGKRTARGDGPTHEPKVMQVRYQPSTALECQLLS